MANAKWHYTVVVNADTTAIYEEVGAVNVTASSPPVLVMSDMDGRPRALIVMSPGMNVQVETVLHPEEPIPAHLQLN